MNRNIDMAANEVASAGISSTNKPWELPFQWEQDTCYCFKNTLCVHSELLFCFCCAVCSAFSGTKISNNFIMFKFKNSITPSLFLYDQFLKHVFLYHILFYIYRFVKRILYDKYIPVFPFYQVCRCKPSILVWCPCSISVIGLLLQRTWSQWRISRSYQLNLRIKFKTGNPRILVH
jgi:hypothetical protein